VNWQPIIELAIAAAMVIGTVVPLYVHTDGKLHDALSSIHNDMKDFQDEMKVFHGRLEKQDAEFRGRMEKQDAEFKAHMMYGHQMKTGE
jgi:hypothetical protein